MLTATVRDDGLGFSKLQTLMKSGLGLQSMRERAEDLGGTLEVTSQPGGGTTVTVRLPLAPEECARAQPHPTDDRRG
jgi:signal transduction histidine kinase